VGTAQLKRNAVTSRKLAPNAVRTAHVVDGSLLAADFKAGQLPSGPKGDIGDKGDRGPAGPGATTFTGTSLLGGSVTLLTLSNGITVTGACNSLTGKILQIKTTSGSPTLQASGTLFGQSGTVAGLDVDSTTDSFAFAGGTKADLGAIARDSSGDNKFARIDVHGSGPAGNALPLLGNDYAVQLTAGDGHR